MDFQNSQYARRRVQRTTFDLARSLIIRWRLPLKRTNILIIYHNGKFGNAACLQEKAILAKNQIVSIKLLYINTVKIGRIRLALGARQTLVYWSA